MTIRFGGSNKPVEDSSTHLNVFIFNYVTAFEPEHARLCIKVDSFDSYGKRRSDPAAATASSRRLVLNLEWIIKSEKLPERKLQFQQTFRIVLPLTQSPTAIML